MSHHAAASDLAAVAAGPATGPTAPTRTRLLVVVLPGSHLGQVGLGQLDLPGRVGRQGSQLLLGQAQPVSLVLPRADDIDVRHGYIPQGRKSGIGWNLSQATFRKDSPVP